MKRYVVGLGEALWDVLPEGKKLGGAPKERNWVAPLPTLLIMQDNSVWKLWLSVPWVRMLWLKKPSMH